MGTLMSEADAADILDAVMTEHVLDTPDTWDHRRTREAGAYAVASIQLQRTIDAIRAIPVEELTAPIARMTQHERMCHSIDDEAEIIRREILTRIASATGPGGREEG